MKFEHFPQKLDLKSLKRLKRFLKIKYYQSLIKKEKLKLGSITFDFKYIFFTNIKIYEYVEMRYTRQIVHGKSLSERIDDLKWKTDIYNIIALLLILLLVYNYFYINIYSYYFNIILPSNNFDEKSITLNKFLFENFLNKKTLSDSLYLLNLFNKSLNNSLFEILLKYDLLL